MSHRCYIEISSIFPAHSTDLSSTEETSCSEKCLRLRFKQTCDFHASNITSASLSFFICEVRGVLTDLHDSFPPCSDSPMNLLFHKFFSLSLGGRYCFGKESPVLNGEEGHVMCGMLPAAFLALSPRRIQQLLPAVPPAPVIPSVHTKSLQCFTLQSHSH